jgi:tetratricopeptide (TPR) repeat protein
MRCDTSTYCNRGSIWLQKGKYSRAIDDFTTAINIDPNYLEAYRDRGTAYLNKGDHNQACSDWKKLCEFGDCSTYHMFCEMNIGSLNDWKFSP